MAEQDYFKTQVWYPLLATHTFLTSFVKLRPEAIEALANGLTKAGDSPAVAAAIEDMRLPMSNILGNCFVSVDDCAPTDTERYINKLGAVYSPESAWRYLAESRKVRQAAAEGRVTTICIRPFRRMNHAREFRLFIKDGVLSAMSQYHLVRHFRRLEGIKEELWNMGKEFVSEIAWLLPVKDLVMDIYLTSNDKILLVDLNPWGAPTDPLLLQTWHRNWDEPAGIMLMAPDVKLADEINVSF